MSQKSKQSSPLSIVMPVYNESEVIQHVVESHIQAICSYFEHVEFIIVDDASTDDTANILDKLAIQHPCLKIIHHPKNTGHGGAVITGFKAASGDFIFQNDSDNQFSPDDFWELYESIKNQNMDLVIGYRAGRQDGLHRKAVSFCGLIAIALLFQVFIRDSNSPFRIYKKGPAKHILSLIPSSSFFPSIGMAVIAKAQYRIEEIPVRHYARTSGITFIRGFKIFRISMRAVKELIWIKKILRAL